MLSTILGALLPTVVTMLLGFKAAWRHDFGEEHAATLNRMVLRYAIPMGLFAGMVSTQRDVLYQDIPLVIAFCAAIIGMYGIGFAVSRVVFRSSTSVAALVALAASMPDVPSMGPAVLGDLLGSASAVPIGLSSLIINLTVLPVTIVLLTMGSPNDQVHDSATQHSVDSPHRRSVLIPILVRSIKQPIVWAPLAAFAIVLVGIRVPHLIIHSLSLLGSASGGVALFASGIILASNPIRISASVLTTATLKNIVQPALLLVALMALPETRIVHEAVLTTALPMGPIVIMLATQYRLAQGGAASAVFVSMVGSVVSMGAFIWLT